MKKTWLRVCNVANFFDYVNNFNTIKTITQTTGRRTPQ